MLFPSASAVRTMGILYIVPTPIGNLEDITLRALRILGEVSLIAAEDTRTSRTLTRHYNIDTPLTSYHQHNRLAKLEPIFAALDAGDVALISDAGTPGISDPGYELVQAAIARGIDVVSLPGANAVTTALAGSGLAADNFLFVGFLPRKTKALKARLAELDSWPATVIVYESPYRLAETLAAVADVMGGGRRICVAREMSKKFEEFYRGTAQEGYDYFAAEKPRGEVTLLIAGGGSDDVWREQDVRRALDERLMDGESLSQASKEVAKLAGWKKNRVYSLGLQER